MKIEITQPSIASAQAILAVEVQHGLPVLFKVAGYYPEDLITVDGKPFHDVERMVVTISGGNGHWTLVSAERIAGELVSGQQRSLPLGQFTIAAAVQVDALRQARQVCAEALATGAVLDVSAAYEEAARVLTKLRTVPALLDRTAYEQACAEFATECLSDQECISYVVAFGEFSFPQAPLATIVRMNLAKRRLADIEAEQARTSRRRRPARAPE